MSFPDADNCLEKSSRLHGIAGTSAVKSDWSSTLGGKILSFEMSQKKILTWVDKFKNIEDIATQYDSGHAALPWAASDSCYRFATPLFPSRMVFNTENVRIACRKETMEVVLIGVEAIARLLLKCAVYERPYPKQGSSRPSVHQDLEIVLEELYRAIMVFLAFAKHYLDKSSARRMCGGPLDLEGKSRFDPINDVDLILVGEIRVAEAESKLSGGRNRRGYPLTH